MEDTRLQLEAHASEVYNINISVHYDFKQHWLSQMKRSVFARAVHNKIMGKVTHEINYINL